MRWTTDAVIDEYDKFAIASFIAHAKISLRLKTALEDILSDVIELDKVMRAIELFKKNQLTEKELICKLNVYKSLRGRILNED